MRLWRPFRRKRSLWHHGLVDAEVRGLEHLAAAMEGEQGVLITPNHPSHADGFVLAEVADQLGVPFDIMTAWQVFDTTGRIGRRILRQHGCFSINREGHDLRAFRHALHTLAERRRPLVIFPEGDVYHLNDRITPFRRGAATVAMKAARAGGRPVACLPCGIKFQFVTDPMPKLLAATERLEAAFSWDARPAMPLARRIHRLVEAVVGLKETAFLGGVQHGTLPARTANLMGAMLGRMEDRFQLGAVQWPVPERVRRLRFLVIQRLEGPVLSPAQHEQCRQDLDDLFQVLQLFSYPVDYLAGNPRPERLSETLDKLEEDVLGVRRAGVRGLQRAIVVLGEPIAVTAEEHAKHAAARLTRRLESSVQALLDELNETAPALETPDPTDDRDLDEPPVCGAIPAMA